MMPTITRAMTVALAATLLILGAGCSSDQSGAQSANGKRTATIDTWNVPASVACSGETSSTVHVSYATTAATRRLILVDGLTISGTDAASDSLDVPVHCDQLPHTFVIVVYDANGRRTSSQKILRTQL